MSDLFEWLVDGCPGATTAPAIVEQCGVRLRAEGVPVERVAAFVMTLHPDVAGRSFTWTFGGAEVRIGELTYERMQSSLFRDSPINVVYRERRELRRQIANRAARDFAVFEELAADGYTDYLAVPLVFTSGESHAFVFATRERVGFSDDNIGAMRRIARPLARIAEIFALRRTAANLLSTYVGRNAGDRVLAGRIRRGDVEVIDAVIWFSDLRGFTELSQRVSAREVIDALNASFECQVAAVHAHGGEVLKFIGDGMLAIFPLAGDVAARCSDAIMAAREAQAAFAGVRADLAFGIALHVGEVAYGNIGGTSRLDFTAIGPAVNLAARLEGLTGKLGRPLVVSKELAAHAGNAVESIGAHQLKGIADAVEVFAPAS